MATALRKTGINVVGDMPWGTHFCHFYEHKRDLLDTLVPYFKTGLENNEFCVWVISEPLTEAEARNALRRAARDLDPFVVDRSLEILLAREWYLKDGIFDFRRVLNGWNAKLDRALVGGYDGIRVSGNTVWLEKKDWKDFCEYENTLNESIIHQPMTALCTYSLAASGAAEILDVARTHQFVLARRGGNWEMIETPEVKQAKEAIQRLNEELEQRVAERTSQLTAVNDELRNEIIERQRAEETLRTAQAELAHVTRVTTLGEMTASIAHEINQPLGAVVNNASACVRWLAAANQEEARQSAALIIADAHRASAIIGRIRAFVKKAPPQKAWVNINDTICEVLALVRSEVHRHRVSLQTHLAEDVPLIVGDRIQVQQVLLNLITNALEAMSGLSEGPRELQVGSATEALPGVRVTVRDSGPGLEPDSLAQLFTAFYTTKPHGLGMGLAISRSIIEAHGGRLWATANAGRGAVFQFTLPRGGERAS